MLRIAEDDAQLRKLGLPDNASLEEGKLLTDDQEKYFAKKIKPRLKNEKATMREIDEVSRVRIFNGLIVNNKGSEDDRILECVAAYESTAAFLSQNRDILSKPIPNEDVLDRCMNTTIGGMDLYGHLVWAERLGDVGAVVDFPLGVDQCVIMRCKVMEGIRAIQRRNSTARGARRYKHVYILDLADISLSSLMTRSAVRELTKAIISGASALFPETVWKLFIVHAPFIFRSAYAIVSPFIHPVTKEKIQILNGRSSYLPALQKAGVPKSAIPAFLGGTCPDKTLASMLLELVAQEGKRA